MKPIPRWSAFLFAFSLVLALSLGAPCFVSDVLAAPSGAEPILIKGMSPASVTSAQNPEVLKTPAYPPGGRTGQFLRILDTDSHDGYVITYSVPTIAEGGVYWLELCASHHTTGWTSQYEISVNGGTYRPVSDASAQEQGGPSYTNNWFYQYVLPVELQVGDSNTIAFRITDKHPISGDFRYTFFLDYMELTPVSPLEIIEGESAKKPAEGTRNTINQGAYYPLGTQYSGGGFLQILFVPTGEYIIDYKVDVPEEGIYLLEVCSSPPTFGWSSKYKMSVNGVNVGGGAEAYMSDANLLRVGNQIGAGLYRYYLPVRLQADENSITFQVSEPRDNADGKCCFYLDYIQVWSNNPFPESEPFALEFDYGTNGGSDVTGTQSVTSDSVVAGTPVALPDARKDDNWRFVGWNEDQNAHTGLLPNGDDPFIMPDHPVYLYAIYEKELQVNLIDIAGATQQLRDINNPKPKLFNNESDVTITVPAQNIYTGWEAIGWSCGSTAPKADVDIISGEYPVSGDTTFYGLYQREYTVHYDTDGGYPIPEDDATTRYTNSDNKEVYVYDMIPLPTGVAKDNHSFAGWKSTVSGHTFAEGAPFPPVAVYTTMKALWTPDQYTVTYNGTANGGTPADRTEETANWHETIDLRQPVAPTADKAGWIFDGWHTDPRAEEVLDFLEVTSDVELYAIYKKVLTATFISYDGIKQTEENIKGTTYKENTAATVEVPELSLYPGWEAKGWVSSPDGSTGSFSPQQIAAISLPDNRTFYGLYERQATLEFKTNGGTPEQDNALCPQFTNSANVSRTWGGDLFLLPEISKTGANFDGWALHNVEGTKYPPGWAFIDLGSAAGATLYAVWIPGQDATEYQYLAVHAPTGWKQGDPDSFNQGGIDEILSALNYEPDPSNSRQLAISYMFDYLRYDIEDTKASLNRMLQLSLANEIPVIIPLDGFAWWDNRPDLWNWWDPDMDGFDLNNINNVEHFDWGMSPDTAVKAGWRNWGAQIRVAPAPNLASAQFRAEQTRALNELLSIITTWYDNLLPEQKYLFGGVVFGRELSPYTQAYFFEDGNKYVLYKSDFLPRLEAETALYKENGTLAGGAVKANASGGKWFHLSTKEIRPYFEYYVNVEAPQTGDYWLEICSSPAYDADSWASRYQVSINGGAYRDVNAATATRMGKVEDVDNFLYRYALKESIPLNQGSNNTIRFRVHPKTETGDFFFLLDYIDISTKEIPANPAKAVFASSSTSMDGNLWALGYAAAQTLNLQPEGGNITKDTIDAICKDYLEFLVGAAIDKGIAPQKIATHSTWPGWYTNTGGGHSGFAAILGRDNPNFAGVIPGWSLYDTIYKDNNIYTLRTCIAEADGPWGIMEFSRENLDTPGFLENVLDHPNNRYVNIFNWSQIIDNPNRIQEIRNALPKP